MFIVAFGGEWQGVLIVCVTLVLIVFLCGRRR